MAIQAIETRYAGCRFRSRLEARWAVFFDTLGIPWEYEPEGYMVGGLAYLPDFWLPQWELWVEVKGTLTQADAEKMCLAACPHSGLPASPDGVAVTDASRCGNRLLVLGSLPQVPVGTQPAHAVLRFWKGDLTAERVVFDGARGYMFVPDYVAPIIWTDLAVWSGESGFQEFAGYDDNGRPLMKSNDRWVDIAESWPVRVAWDSGTRAAYTVARSARFEHGESG